MSSVESVGVQVSSVALGDVPLEEVSAPSREIEDTIEVKEEQGSTFYKNAFIAGCCIAALTILVAVTSFFIPKSKVDESLKAKLDHMKREGSPEGEVVDDKEMTETEVNIEKLQQLKDQK